MAAAPDPVQVVPDFMGGLDLAVGGRLRSAFLRLPTQLPPVLKERFGRLNDLLDIEYPPEGGATAEVSKAVKKRTFVETYGKDASKTR